MAQGIHELLWLKMILKDLKIKWDGSMRLYCDNKSSINITHKVVQHNMVKHIEIDRNFIKLDTWLRCTNSQLADVLTKSLSNLEFQTIIVKLRMDNVYLPA